MVIPLTPTEKPIMIGIENFNLNTFMGQTLDWLKWPNFLGLIFSAVAFVVATFFVIQYTKGFFAGRKIPKSWKLLLWGIFITAIAEIGEMLSFYEWPNPGFIEVNFLLVIPHAIGGFLIGLGAYFLYKEVTT